VLVPTVRHWKPRVTGYFENVVQQYNELEFRTMSRISRVVTDMLVKILSKSKSVRRVCELSVVHGREAIDMHKQLLFSTSAHRTWNVRLQTSLVHQSHLSTGALQH